MKRYLLVTPGYPTQDNPYTNAFVHVRVKRYIEAGLELEVFSVNRRPLARQLGGARYEYDGVKAEKGNLADLRAKLESVQYDKVLVHFAHKNVLKCVLDALPNTPVIIWCHGVDVVSWRRRLYNLRLGNCVKFAGYALLNTLQRLYLHRVTKTQGPRLTFVFVSRWLKDIAERDMWRRGQLIHYAVIPNVVDEREFQYRQKDAQDRLRLLSIRAFASRNYANDQTVKAISLLTARPFFSELQFTICGTGRLWTRTVAPLRKYPNVRLENRFFTHQEIVALHGSHGVMLMPSRQDTQGVSTCEGMSSGLVPISSRNSAIPEFVPDTCGILTENAQEIAAAIERLYASPEQFLSYSQAAAEYIQTVCSSAQVIPRELSLITEGEEPPGGHE